MILLLSIVLASMQGFHYVGSEELLFSQICPSSLLNKLLSGYLPRDKEEAGKFTKYGAVDSIKSCVDFCCQDSDCHVSFRNGDSCYGVTCRSKESCSPEQQPNDSSQLSEMVLVRPVEEDPDWQDLFYSATENRNDDMLMAGSEVNSMVSCGGGCSKNEDCTRDGVCVCKENFVRKSRDCVPSTRPEFLESTSKAASKMAAAEIISNLNTKAFVNDELKKGESQGQRLTVSVRSQTIRLPESEASLSAFTVPSDEGKLYTYQWDTLSKPVESEDTTSEKSDNMMTLSHLTEGLYTFRVTVTGPNNASGVAYANLTVLPPNRINKPPVASVRPINQTVKLPNSMAVLDGSASEDDSGITKYQWELQEGPLGYELNSTGSETLVLRDLQKPGNYTFRLTVTDENGASNWTMAHVCVLEAPDYPPVANAGPSTVLYLPRNNVTLNGSLSSDDKGIVLWEWTKSPSDHDKAVDMQDTHTPYLRLSLLTEGMYTFVLKVTDEAGQSSSSETIVLVKPPTNKPPTANAGHNVTIALPQTYTQLNGTSSSDDISIAEWKWSQISGPNTAIISSSNTSITNVTGLTKGVYHFQLMVIDNSGNSASDTVIVQVTQSVNEKPVADAGGDQTLVMPVDVMVVNGSLSHDDFRIASWQWTREPTSLAVGTIINHSDKSPVLMVTNIVTGRYEFRLRVTDDQGEFAEDTVSIIVKPDMQLRSLVEVTLNVASRQLMESQRDTAVAKLGLLVGEGRRLMVRGVSTEPTTGRATLTLYVVGPNGSSILGPKVVHTLRSALAKDTSLLLPLSVAYVDTVICQNNCSGHGVCVQSTRACLCEAFWMEDLFSKYFGNKDANCDWSILYVLIALLVSILLLACFGWALCCLIQRVCCPKPNQPHNKKYSLLDSTDQIKLPVNKVIVSEDSDETDSDVLFETTRSGSAGNKGRSKIFSNGYKQDRTSRVKT